MIRYIHYAEVIERIHNVKQYLWRIGTANIKDFYVKEGVASVPLLKGWRI